MIDEDQVLKVSLAPSVVSREVGEEMILLHMGTEYYYGLDELGRRMLTELLATSVPADVADGIAQEYDVEAAVVRHDLRAFVQELVDAGLVRVEPG